MVDFRDSSVAPRRWGGTPRHRERSILTAQFLEAILPVGQKSLLKNFLPTGHSAFRQDFTRLSAGEQSSLKNYFGERGLEELLSLAEEPDPEIFLHGLLNLGMRLENSDRLQAAAGVYQFIREVGASANNSRRTVPLQVVRGAEARWNAMSGTGSSGARAEFLLRRLTREALEPTALLGMAAASTAFRVTRLAILNRLIARPMESLLTRGFGARATASFVGFGVEAVIFPAATRTGKAVLGEELEWTTDQIGREVASSFILLGALKLVGWGTVRAMNSVGAGPLPRQIFNRIFPQTGMLGGIYLGHQAETALGLRPHLDNATTFLDSLTLLLQFNVGGELSRRAMGPRFSREMQATELAAEVSNPRANQKFFPQEPPWVLAEHPSGSRVLPTEIPQNLPLQMAGRDRGTSMDRSFLTARLASHLSGKLHIPEGDRKIQRIAEHFSLTPFTVDPRTSLATYYTLLAGTGIRSMVHPDGKAVSAQEVLETSSHLFRFVMITDPLRRVTGTLFDHLVQIAFERVLVEKRQPHFDKLLRVVAVERDLPALEKFFAENAWLEDYQFRKPSWVYYLAVKRLTSRLKALQLPPDVQEGVAGYLATLAWGSRPRGFRDPAYNFLWLQRRRETAIEAPLPADVALRSLEHVLKSRPVSEDWQRAFHGAVRRSMQSNIPLLFMDRLFKIVATGDLPEKMAEMSGNHAFNWEYLQGQSRSESLVGRRRSSAGKAKYEGLAARINGTIYTGFVWDEALAKKFAFFYQAVPALLDPEVSRRSREEFYEKADILLGKKANFSAADVLEMLDHRPTEMATRARQTIRNGEVDFQIWSRRRWEDYFKRRRSIRPEDAEEKGHFLSAERSPTGKPLIVILELEPDLSRQDKIIRALFLAAITVHEFEHYLHDHEIDRSTPRGVLRGEMRAWLEENLFVLQQGEPGVWRAAEQVSPDGFGIYLRKSIDFDYLGGPKGFIFGP